MSENDKPRMQHFMVRFPKELLEQAKEKADLTPLSAVIRRLVEKWVKGEIDLD